MAKKPKKNKSIQLEKIQGLIWRGQYRLKDHAQEPINDGELDLDDIECSIKNGEITKNQKDELGEAKDGRKYTITGPTYSGLPITTVGKIVEKPDGEKYLLITAYIPS